MENILCLSVTNWISFFYTYSTISFLKKERMSPKPSLLCINQQLDSW